MLFCNINDDNVPTWNFMKIYLESPRKYGNFGIANEWEPCKVVQRKFP